MFLYQIRLKMHQKGLKMDQKGLKIDFKRLASFFFFDKEYPFCLTKLEEGRGGSSPPQREMMFIFGGNIL